MRELIALDRGNEASTTTNCVQLTKAKLYLGKLFLAGKLCEIRLRNEEEVLALFLRVCFRYLEKSNISNLSCEEYKRYLKSKSFLIELLN